MNEAFESYKLYHALKLHFTTKNYDFIKFRGKAKAFSDARKFDARNDKYFYYRLSARYKSELKEFYISVFANGDDCWIGDLLGDKYHRQFNEWLARKQAFTKMFTDDVNTIVEFMEERDKSFKELLLPDGNNLPIIMRLGEQGFISTETIIVINRLTHFVEKGDNKHPFWKDKKLLITKYNPFVEVNEIGNLASILKEGIDKNR